MPLIFTVIRVIQYHFILAGQLVYDMNEIIYIIKSQSFLQLWLISITLAQKTQKSLQIVLQVFRKIAAKS